VLCFADLNLDEVVLNFPNRDVIGWVAQVVQDDINLLDI
jgi:hypothetical protein